MKLDEPLDISGWREMDDATRRRVVDLLRPTMRRIASELGATTARERRDVLEVVGLSSLAEAGWSVLAVAKADGRPESFL